MNSRKRALYETFARVGKTLASASRLEILDLLAQSERSVEALASESGLSIANMSQHLQSLRRARLVEARRQGLRIVYRLASPEVGELFRVLRDVAAARLAEMDEIAGAYLEGRDDLEPVSRAELLRRMREGTVTVLDVRPREEFLAGHLRGALCVPLEDLDAWMRTAPRRRRVVAICRGPYCVFALQAAGRLVERGFDATHSRDGVLELRAAGIRLQAGP